MFAILLILHFIADSVFQSREMAKNKSSDIDVLYKHLLIQFFVFFIGGSFFFPMKEIFILSFVNAAIHGIIDWNIWNWYKISVMKRIPFEERRTFQFWEDKKFYDTIMLDQLLHTLTIYLLYIGLF